MKTLKERTIIAENAINSLRNAIEMGKKQMVLDAYSIVEDDDDFTWDGLDVLFLEWDELADQGNEIIYS